MNLNGGLNCLQLGFLSHFWFILCNWLDWSNFWWSSCLSIWNWNWLSRITNFHRLCHHFLLFDHFGWAIENVNNLFFLRLYLRYTVTKCLFFYHFQIGCARCCRFTISCQSCWNEKVWVLFNFINWYMSRRRVCICVLNCTTLTVNIALMLIGWNILSSILLFDYMLHFMHFCSSFVDALNSL